jgi:hypothetical protein
MAHARRFPRPWHVEEITESFNAADATRTGVGLRPLACGLWYLAPAEVVAVGSRLMRIVRIAAGAVIAALLALTPAQAAKRVALVIGNDRYAALPQLRNADGGELM